MSNKKIMGKVSINAKGTSFHQGPLWNLNKNSEGAWIELRREKLNERDPNAIAIIAHTKNTRAAKVGYIPADKSIWLAPKMDAGKVVRAYQPVIIGKAKGLTLGLHIDVVHQIA